MATVFARGRISPRRTCPPQPPVAIAKELHLSVARGFVDDGAERGDFADLRRAAASGVTSRSIRRRAATFPAVGRLKFTYTGRSDCSETIARRRRGTAE